MTTPRVPFEVSQTGYTYTDPSLAASSAAAGGLSRLRADHLAGTVPVGVGWNLGPADYNTLVAFFNDDLQQGALPFLVDLVMDAPQPEERVARFVPDTFSLVSITGMTYSVSATLEVEPSTPDDDYDQAILMLFEIYGSEEGVLDVLGGLETLVNVTIPEDRA